MRCRINLNYAQRTNCSHDGKQPPVVIPGSWCVFDQFNFPIKRKTYAVPDFLHKSIRPRLLLPCIGNHVHCFFRLRGNFGSFDQFFIWSITKFPRFLVLRRRLPVSLLILLVVICLHDIANHGARSRTTVFCSILNDGSDYNFRIAARRKPDKPSVVLAFSQT